MAYVVKFVAIDASDVITSPYNKRASNLEEIVTRGSILSADGKVLAETVTEDGKEKRVYPFGRVFAHAVGYNIYGKAGLESVYNYDLLSSHVNIFDQIKNGITGTKNQGDMLITTLDSELQQAAYDALCGYRGAIVAIDPTTGAVKALASNPDFDPNELEDRWEEISSDEDKNALYNRATQGLYPPGSTYKILTALEFIRENPDTYKDFSFQCDSETVVNSVKIHCYENENHGKVDLSEAFAESCNTAFVTLGCQLDTERFISMNKECLYNKKIDFDLSVIRSSFPFNKESDISEMPQTVIGQGDTLTSPFHNALIACALANDGILMKPYMVSGKESEDGLTVKTIVPEEYCELMSRSESKVIGSMMREAVKTGTCSVLNTDRYQSYGKTGTAENEKEKPHSWFVGYAKEDGKKLAVCVLMENQGTGSSYAAPAAKMIFDRFFD